MLSRLHFRTKWNSQWNEMWKSKQILHTICVPLCVYIIFSYRLLLCVYTCFKNEMKMLSTSTHWICRHCFWISRKKLKDVSFVAFYLRLEMKMETMLYCLFVQCLCMDLHKYMKSLKNAEVNLQVARFTLLWLEIFTEVNAIYHFPIGVYFRCNWYGRFEYSHAFYSDQ